MFVNEVNDVKIYNLSAGKSVPDWLTDRRQRSKLLKKVDTRRQIELIQDFDMPAVCTTIRMSPDQQYILASGTYKPRVKCFEVNNLSIKFERCFDSEVTTFEVISEDYSKMLFLQCDRFVELHSPSGRHYRLRIPRFGRDLKYHKPSCDTFIVGTSNEIYRLNLERGQFLQPFETEASCLNACDINPEHQLLMVGSKEGTLEAWDPRSRTRCATLDVAIKIPGSKEFPSVSTLKFKNGLQMGVGTASGHVLLYDIRSREPLIIKEHLNKLPIKRLAFNEAHQAVYSLDGAMLKLWNEQTGKQIAYIEAANAFNDFCTIPNSGMLFLAQEEPKMLTYYVPGMGPAPRWCSFLDNLTEEIESEVVEHMYDDYQFITQKELEELGLDHLVGSNLLKAYMHGYFVDVRLYNKAKAVVEPFAFDRFRKEKIRQEIESERKSRLQIKSNLPKVNQELAYKILRDQAQPAESKSKKPLPNLLQDERFKAMFENADFEINKNAEEYKLLAPVLNRLDKSRNKAQKVRRVEVAPVEQLQADESKPHEDSDNDEDLFGFDKLDAQNGEGSDDSDNAGSSDEEHGKEFAKEMRRAYKDVRRQRDEDDAEEEAKDSTVVDQGTSSKSHNNQKVDKKIKVVPLEATFGRDVAMQRQQMLKVNLGGRVRIEEQLKADVTNVGHSLGNRQMSFEMRKAPSRELKKREYELKRHREERRKIVRPLRGAVKLKKVNYK